MAWSTPATWVAGAVLTAAQLNAQLRDNLAAAFPDGVGGAWTSYTPTLTQGATVTKTVTAGRYQRVGRVIHVSVILTVTGSGTASNDIVIGLPVAAIGAISSPGSGYVHDVSAGRFAGVVFLISTTTVSLLPTGVNSGFLGSAGMTGGLVSGDVVAFSATYEAAT